MYETLEKCAMFDMLHWFTLDGDSEMIGFLTTGYEVAGHREYLLVKNRFSPLALSLAIKNHLIFELLFT